MLSYITHDYVMLYNTRCYVIKYILCYITRDMLLHNT